MGYSRNIPMSGGIDPDVVAAIASDPEGYKSRKAELVAAFEAAQAASAEAIQRRADLNEKEQALNDKAAQLEKRSAEIQKTADDFASANIAADTKAAARSKELKDVASGLASQAELLSSREADVARWESKAASLLRQTQSDNAAAAALLAKLNDVAAGLSTLAENLASLG